MCVYTVCVYIYIYEEKNSTKFLWEDKYRHKNTGSASQFQVAVPLSYSIRHAKIRHAKTTQAEKQQVVYFKGPVTGSNQGIVSK